MRLPRITFRRMMIGIAVAALLFARVRIARESEKKARDARIAAIDAACERAHPKAHFFFRRHPDIPHDAAIEQAIEQAFESDPVLIVLENERQTLKRNIKRKTIN